MSRPRFTIKHAVAAALVTGLAVGSGCRSTSTVTGPADDEDAGEVTVGPPMDEQLPEMPAVELGSVTWQPLTQAEAPQPTDPAAGSAGTLFMEGQLHYLGPPEARPVGESILVLEARDERGDLIDALRHEAQPMDPALLLDQETAPFWRNAAARVAAEAERPGQKDTSAKWRLALPTTRPPRGGELTVSLWMFEASAEGLEARTIDLPEPDSRAEVGPLELRRLADEPRPGSRDLIFEATAPPAQPVGDGVTIPAELIRLRLVKAAGNGSDATPPREVSRMAGWRNPGNGQPMRLVLSVPPETDVASLAFEVSWVRGVTVQPRVLRDRPLPLDGLRLPTPPPATGTAGGE